MFGVADVLVTPTVGLTAPLIGVGMSTLPDIARRNFVSFTFLQNYTGLPAASVPCGLVNGLPVGLQIIARRGQEALILRLCQGLESLGAFPMPN
jgi:Asp-tRNA(Asn)/Glu-tRNA(Gln) amidotransferase A subunit family amidase